METLFTTNPAGFTGHHQQKIVTDLNEMTNILEKVYLHGSALELWQETKGGQATFLQGRGRIINVNVYSNELILRPWNFTKAFLFDKKSPIYVKSPSGAIIFKTNISSFCRKHYLNIKMPSNILLTSSVRHPRFYFDHLVTKVYYNNFTAQDYSRKTVALEAQLVDISRTGMALRLLPEMAENHRPGDRLIFTDIHAHTLPRKISGTIVYLQKAITFDNESYMRAGIIFDWPFPLEEILQVTPKIFYGA